MKTNTDAEAVSQLALAVFRLNGALLHWGDQLVESLGLTSARWQMLGALSLAGAPLTAPQIGEAMGVSRQGAQKQLNLLLEQGLVESRRNPAHKRSPHYALTPQGSDAYQRAMDIWTSRATELARLFSTGEIRETAGRLESILEQVQAAIPKPENE